MSGLLTTTLSPTPTYRGRYDLIAAIDPGGTTGIAWTADGSVSGIQTCNVPGYDFAGVADKLWLELFDKEIRPEDCLVYERFATGGMLSRDGLKTIEMGAELRGVARYIGLRVQANSPAMRKAWQHAAHKWLLAQGAAGRPYAARAGHRDDVTIHEEDALAHLFMYLETVLKVEVR